MEGIKRKVFISRPEKIVRTVSVSGNSGQVLVGIPSNFKYLYSFLTVYNDTGYTITLPMWVIPPRTVLTIPFSSDMIEGFLFLWAGSGTTGSVKLVFSAENLSMAGSLGNGQIDTVNAQIITDIGQWAITQDSAANTAQTLTKGAVAGQKHYISGMDVNISGAAAGNAIVITLSDGVSLLLKTSIANGAAIGTSQHLIFTKPIMLSVNTAANLAVSAGGVGCVTTANLIGYTQ